MNWPNDTCDRYWEDADWLPPGYILDHRCQQDARCRHAKQQVLLVARASVARRETSYRHDETRFEIEIPRELVEIAQASLANEIQTA